MRSMKALSSPAATELVSTIAMPLNGLGRFSRPWLWPGQALAHKSSESLWKAGTAHEERSGSKTIRRDDALTALT
jgi:hypothetical protein